MAKLKPEYTDLRDVKHHVEHLTVSESGSRSREQIIEELIAALVGREKRIPT